MPKADHVTHGVSAYLVYHFNYREPTTTELKTQPSMLLPLAAIFLIIAGACIVYSLVLNMIAPRRFTTLAHGWHSFITMCSKANGSLMRILNIRILDLIWHGVINITTLQ